MIPYPTLKMEWGDVVFSTKQWVASSSSGIEVSSVNESERRIYLTSPSSSFFVTVPQQDQEEWVGVLVLKTTPTN